jgi:hypothetical protein
MKLHRVSGSWYYNDSFCRVYYQYVNSAIDQDYDIDVGFRLWLK